MKKNDDEESRRGRSGVMNVIIMTSFKGDSLWDDLEYINIWRVSKATHFETIWNTSTFEEFQRRLTLRQLRIYQHLKSFKGDSLWDNLKYINIWRVPKATHFETI